MFYLTVYRYLYEFANYPVHGILLCRLLAPLFFLSMVWVSRLNSSVALKLFAVVVALLFYFLPDVVNVFAG